MRRLPMAEAEHPIEHAGDARHPDHERWLQELGRTTHAAARVAGVSFDVLRVFHGVPGEDMYSNPMGKLLSRLQVLLIKQPLLPGLRDFVEKLEVAKLTRNDLLHALPVLHGLHRRETKDLFRVRNFFDVDDLRTAEAQLDEAARLGNHVLYHDGGTAIEAWYAAQTS